MNLLPNFSEMPKSHQAVHDYVQWIFPTDEASMFNGQAPLLSPELAAICRHDAQIQQNFDASQHRAKGFINFTLRCCVSMCFLSVQFQWLCPSKDRILERFLSFLGLQMEEKKITKAKHFDTRVLASIRLAASKAEDACGYAWLCQGMLCAVTLFRRSKMSQRCFCWFMTPL